MPTNLAVTRRVLTARLAEVEGCSVGELHYCIDQRNSCPVLSQYISAYLHRILGCASNCPLELLPTRGSLAMSAVLCCWGCVPNVHIGAFVGGNNNRREIKKETKALPDLCSRSLRRVSAGVVWSVTAIESSKWFGSCSAVESDDV